MIGDARTTSRGPFLRENDFRQLRDASKSAQTIVRTPGVNMIRTPFGTVMDFKGTGTLWAYAFKTTATHVVCKLAIDTGTKFAVSTQASAFIKPRMAPGLTAAHFAKHLVTTPQPTPQDQCCTIEGGLCAPYYRMLPTAPAPASALLPSCTPSADAVADEPCCQDCAQAAVMAEAWGLPAPEGCGCGG